MLTRKTLVIGNWKMHLNTSQASLLTARLHKQIGGHHDIEVVLAPSTLSLQPLSHEIDRRRFRLAAQNAYFKDEGGFTGEISFSMLRDLVHYVIIGHSERRIFFNESLETVRDKVAACVRNGLTPILCVGETSTERHDGMTRQVLHDQLTTALSDLTAEDVAKMVIAYEPVWAISNLGGELAKPSDVAKNMSFIRAQISELYGESVSKEVRLLYGGSVDEHIVRGYIEIEGCDGVLVGSASLNYHKFSGIVDVIYRYNRERKEG
jgi:triosephosphate isomerase (TIM)